MTHRVGKPIAQATLALLLALIVAEGALAADICDCPECPPHACMHVGCAGGNDGARCPELSGDACPSAFAATLAPAPRDGSPTFWMGIAISASRSVVSATDDSAIARRMAAPPFATPPAHIVFCRLLR